MKKLKYLILGAGPAGLAFAAYLQEHGEESYLLLEKEEEAGGLCRTLTVDGVPVDIGGGHFLDTRNQFVNEFLLKYMPLEEWNVFDRDSQIDFEGQLIGSPFEANIWQLPIERQVEYLKSIAVAGCNIGEPIPEKFIDWIYWKLGRCIAEDYMIPYNKKMFSENLNELGTYWLNKLPSVSLEDTLHSCLERKVYGQQPCHSKFYYPKEFGYGELWLRIQKSLGKHYIGNVDIKSIDFENKIINEKYSAENIITTIPWTAFTEIYGMPQKMFENIKKLKFSSVQVEYFNKPLDQETTAQWIYYPSRELSYHRILLMTNFVPNVQGYWTETNSERIDKKSCARYKYLNEYAYPLNTLEKPKIMNELMNWSREQHVYGLGRWGEWQHFNSDVVVERALNLAKELYGI